MEIPRLAPRLARLPLVEVLGIEARVAAGFRSRLLGLALLEEEEAGPGLLLPRCSSVHTVGMRFTLDIVFFDAKGVILTFQRNVGTRRILRGPGAEAVLEVPAGAIRLRD